MFKIIFALIAIACSSSHALADWQYAKWGMTAPQLEAASKGRMKPCGAACDKQHTNSETALLYTPYQSGEFQFTAFAFFNNNTKKLSYMVLRLDNQEKAYQLIAALKSKYGEPTSQSRTQLSTNANWRGSGDQIAIMVIGTDASGYTTLIYSPKLTNSNKGL
jgi:hypothetical protein